MPLPLVKRLVKQVLVGLSFIHSAEQQIIHTDLKPENILLCSQLPPAPKPPPRCDGQRTEKDTTPDAAAAAEAQAPVRANSSEAEAAVPATAEEAEQVVAAAVGDAVETADNAAVTVGGETAATDVSSTSGARSEETTVRDQENGGRAMSGLTKNQRKKLKKKLKKQQQGGAAAAAAAAAAGGGAGGGGGASPGQAPSPAAQAKSDKKKVGGALHAVAARAGTDGATVKESEVSECERSAEAQAYDKWQLAAAGLSEEDMRNMQCKIVDLGNACWVHKQFTADIQTRQYRCPEVRA
jgi:serine/threonine-protein kinase SRPK3